MKSQAIGQSLYHMNENTKNQDVLSSLITAKIVAKDNGHVLLQCGDKKISAKVPAGFAGEIGQEFDFEVMQQEGQITLRLTNYIDQYADIDNKGAYDGKNARFVDFTVNSLQPKDVKSLVEERVEDHKEKVESLKQAKNRMESVLNATTPSAVAAMAAEGIAMENITFDMLERISTEIHLQPDEEMNNLEKMLEESGVQLADTSAAKEYGNILTEAGLPLTDHNMQSLEKLDQRMDALSGLDSENLYAVLRNMEAPTLKELYILKHSAVGGEQPPVPEETVAAMADDIENIMQLENIEMTGENKALAHEFVKHHVPVTKKHFDVEKILSEGNFDRHAILAKGAEQIKNGQDIYDVAVTEDSTRAEPAPYNDLLARLPEVNPQVIDQLLYKEIPVNLQNMLQEELSLQPAPLTATQQEKSLALKRQFLEIQLKLTTEAAGRLAAKDIAIDTLPLQEALEEVKQAQKELATMALSYMDTPATQENIAQMEHVYNQKGYIRHFLSSGEAFIQTDGLEDISIDNIVAFSQKIDEYEKNSTDVNPKFKDHFGKVSGQFKDLLTSMAIEPTENNITMAKSLSRNGIDVTPENILEAKLIDTKLKFIETHFHPAIAAKMIEEGVRPTELHLDELIEYIHAFKDIYGENTEKYFAKQIYEMDHSGAFNPGEREGILAVYKMLHQISKYDAAAIGAGIKSGHTNTIHSLWESSKYYDKTKANKSYGDVKIDDTFGVLEEKRTQNSIYEDLKQLYAAASSTLEKDQADLLENSVLGKTWQNVQLVGSMKDNGLPTDKNVLHQMAYDQGLLQEIFQKAQPDIIQANEAFTEIELEALVSGLRQEETSAQYSEIQNSLKDLGDFTAVMFQWMQDKNVPQKVGYMNSFQKMVKNPQGLSEDLAELQQYVGETLDIPTPQDLGEYKDLDDVLSDMSRKAAGLKDHLAVDDMQARKSLGQVQMALQLSKELYQKEEAVSFPVRMGERLQTVNMFFLHDIAGKETVQTVFHVNTANLGTVEMHMATSAQGVALTITAEREENLRFIASKESLLRDLLKEENILDIQYALGAHQTLKEKIEPEPLGESHIFDHYFETSI